MVGELSRTKNRALRWLFCRCVLAMFAATAYAQDSRLALSAKFANIGPGLDLTYGLSRNVHTRLTVHYAPSENLSDNDDIKAAGSLLLDWHPGGGQFRLSGGLAVLRERLGGHTLFGAYFIPPQESTSYTSYLGIGWGNPLRPGSRWNFSVDVGGYGGGGFSYSSGTFAEATTAHREGTEAGRIRFHTPEWRLVVSTGVSFRF